MHYFVENVSVTVLNIYTLYYHASYLYQVSRKYLKIIKQIAILIFTKGNNFTKVVRRVTVPVLHTSSHHAIYLYHVS